MTRINVGVMPKELPSKLLLAEHREIKRIPNTLKSGKAKVDNIPNDFRLGTGHVKFFYNKVGYLKNRYISLYNECLNRGFNVTSYLDAFEGLNNGVEYKPSIEDRKLIIERIESKGFELWKPFKTEEDDNKNN